MCRERDMKVSLVGCFGAKPRFNDIMAGTDPGTQPPFSRHGLQVS